jgi:Flp pilus assembly protein TadG
MIEGGRNHRPTDRGFAGVWLMLLMVILLMVGGLSIDLWRAFSERRAMAESAEAAARAGANGVDLEAFDLTGAVALDPDLAAALAEQHLQQHNESRYVTGRDVDADTETVTVRISGTVEVTLLGMVGIGSLDVSVSAEAEPRLQRASTTNEQEQAP